MDEIEKVMMIMESVDLEETHIEEVSESLRCNNGSSPDWQDNIIVEVPEGRKESPGDSWQSVGFLPFHSAETITRALNLGVDVKMVRGDQLAIGNETGCYLGIRTNMDLSSSLLGDNKDKPITALQIGEMVQKGDGFAGVSTGRKPNKIVKRLQVRKQTGGVTSVAGTTDAARSASDIVLTGPAHLRMKNYTISGVIHSVICLLALCLWATLVISPVSALTDPQERQVLQDLYRSLNLNNEGDPCEEGWEGIRCSGPTVTSIELPGQKLNGTLGGNLFDLQNLKKLDLSDNSINGEIPLSLPPNAIEVNLALNKFNQSTPLSLNPMKYLENLNISHNSLSCSLGNFFTGFPSLRQLDLSHNSFTGKLPGSISASTKLTSLFLQRNKFEGSVDPLKNLPLNTLWIQFNKFTGVIPDSLFNISNLRVEKNYFKDNVPIVIGEIHGPSVPASSVKGKNNTASPSPSRPPPLSPPPPPPPPPPPQVVITKKKNLNYYIVGSVLLILLVIVGGLLLWYWRRARPTTNGSSNGSSLELGNYRRIKCN